jgi:hypothetical protein
MCGSSSTLSTKVGTHAARHAHSQPVRSTERMALITSRMSVVRGCPPGLAGGMSGSRVAHSLSLISLGYLLRCIFPPLPSFPSRDSLSFFTPPVFYHLPHFLAESLTRLFYRPYPLSPPYSGLYTQPLNHPFAFARLLARKIINNQLPIASTNTTPSNTCGVPMGICGSHDGSV